MNQPETPSATSASSGWLYRSLDVIERVGNRLPDPAMLFLMLMVVVWILSWLLSGMNFDARHPTTGDAITISNL
ncbi:MAG: AbgT family transporter, partial [Wenzhouxiangellaceae bacterium]